MTPEAAGHLDKARECLMRARIILAAGIAEDAARAAYLAAFHGAQALIAERTGRVAKTHKGAHVAFARLTKDEPRIDMELRRFLPQSFNMKAVADYELGPRCRDPHGTGCRCYRDGNPFRRVYRGTVGDLTDCAGSRDGRCVDRKFMRLLPDQSEFIARPRGVGQRAWRPRHGARRRHAPWRGHWPRRTGQGLPNASIIC